MAEASNLQTAVLGGGCFWCLEAVFQQLAGVESVVSGYAGGSVPNPTYKQVCTGTTGHAEVVQVTFDPGVVAYSELLEVFFHIHDPTTLNRQGADVGTQYRSIVLTVDDEQQKTAEDVKRRLEESGAFRDSLVTDITPLSEFYPAEDDHQNYFNDNPRQPYCATVVGPKVQKFREKFAARLKERE